MKKYITLAVLMLLLIVAGRVLSHNLIHVGSMACTVLTLILLLVFAVLMDRDSARRTS